MIKEEEQADKQGNDQGEKTQTRVQPQMSEIMQDVEELTTRSGKEKKDFQNIQLLGAPIPYQSGVKLPTPLS